MESKEYPRNPVGLRWDDHYTMSDQVYAAYVAHAPRPLPGIRREMPKGGHGAFKKRLGGRRIA